MERSRLFDGVKFLWDGVEYRTEKEALAEKAACEREGFAVQVVAEGGKYWIFTRRVAREQPAPERPAARPAARPAPASGAARPSEVR